MKFGKIGEFDVQSGSWRSYCERLECYFVANEVPVERQLPTLISVVGEAAYELMVNLCSPKKPATMKYKEVVEVMEKHLQPTPSILAERFKFRQYRQVKGQTVAQYVAELKKMARDCSFGTTLDDNMRDQFVCGLSSDIIRQRLFAEAEINFNKAVTLALSLEAAERDSTAVERCAGGGAAASDPGAEVHSASVHSVSAMGCMACGDFRHKQAQCKFNSYICSRCNVVGHLRRICPMANEGSSGDGLVRGNQSRNGSRSNGWRSAGLEGAAASWKRDGPGTAATRGGYTARGARGRSRGRGRFNNSRMHWVEEDDQLYQENLPYGDDEENEDPIYHMNLDKYKPNETIVTVQQGQLQGSVDTLYDGSSYYSFRGIPYAQPPVGQLRFKAPLPPQPWEGVHPATAYGSACAQTQPGAGSVFKGSEDCLFLNVFTKSLTRRQPVMVFIHGGSFYAGSGDDLLYGPKFLVQRDVVLVTLNYRLEVLGFLSLDTAEVPGNAGMKDQVAALKWVKENIAKFGGDPENITLFGESAGACSVTHHIISPMSSGLFHKAIAQSGTSLHDWAIGHDSKSRAFRLGKYLGNDTEDTTVLLEFFRSLPVEKLTNVTLATATEDELVREQPEQFLPVVENTFENVEAFLSEDPVDTLLLHKTSKIPLLLGYNSAEGILMIQDRLDRLESFNKNVSNEVPLLLAEKVNFNSTRMNELGTSIRNFYVGDREFTKDDYKQLVSMRSDKYYIYDTHRFAHLYSEYNSPIYMYRFGFVSDLNVMKATYSDGLDLEGACHGDDVFYMFSNNITEAAYKAQDSLQSYVLTVTKLWTDYAKTSNPTLQDVPKWPAYTTVDKQYLDINVDLSTGSFANQQAVEFWDSLYCELGLPCIKNN